MCGGTRAPKYSVKKLQFPPALMARVAGLLVMICRLPLNSAASLQSPELLPSGGHGQWRPAAATPHCLHPRPSRAELISGSNTHPGRCRGLQLPQGEAPLHQGQVVLLHHGLHARWVWLGVGGVSPLAAAAAGMILVTSSFVTFWIEWNAEPARVTLGVTTMLNFFTTSNK